MTKSRPHDALMEITARPEQIFVHGRGSYLWDEQGRRYLDFVQGWAVNSLGHCHPAVIEALQGQANELINPSPAYYNAPSIALANELTRQSCFDRVFFASSGAEANEGAIKLARRWGARYRAGASDFITFEHAFHGRTLATMSASGKAAFEQLFEPKVPGFAKARLNDLDSVEALITERTVAVMLEPCQGEAGVIQADDSFMQQLRELTTERGILLIVDEVQTGIGRTGRLFGYQHAGIDPDIMTLGKGIGGGVPLAALLATEAVACFEHGDQGGTYCGNPLMTAVGLAVVGEVGERAFLAEVNALGAHLRDGLGALSRRHALGDVRGRGLLLAQDLGRPIGAELAARALESGLLINAPNANSLRFMPALNVSRNELDEGLATLDRLLSAA